MILTGISGTGKTQLAIKVADFFRRPVRVRRPKAIPDGALEMTVKPYMLKHARLIVPQKMARLRQWTADATEGERKDERTREDEGRIDDMEASGTGRGNPSGYERGRPGALPFRS